ncbi:MAG TPA: HAMP domain-containing protein, partial [Thermoanaerobaculia bacterium]
MTESGSEATHRSVRRPAFVIWLVALGTIIGLSQITPLLERVGVGTGLFTFLSFIAWLSFIAISLYWITVAIRWTLQKLFWRVGRRLFLSYVLIGALPFVLVFVLLVVVGYMIAGVMSHAALRGERQATLGQMESWALEYGLTGKRPPNALPSLEIYDTAKGDEPKLPHWLRTTSFSGFVRRDGMPLLVTSRQFPTKRGELARAVVFVQPVDENWSEQLEEKGGMVITFDTGDPDQRARVNVGGQTEDYEVKTDAAFQRIMERGAAFDRVIWADFNALTEWETGQTNRRQQLVTFISTPVRNLFQFYFGAASGRYLGLLQNVILGLVVMLLMIYMFAALFAAVLIFSISRAVNRIEKGTKAVERGDFSYRIRMKPQNQLGEMAQSFDRMTESIASLLSTVAEKERLQSEIEIAATIQRNLLPKEGPQFGGVSFSAHFEPTTSIGGDYYDVFNLSKSKLAVTIGDVSGHGLSTGLVMAMVKAAITTLVEEGAD